jgi:hypothetical protein
MYSNACSKKGCKNKEILAMVCQECKKNFCLTHRSFIDHDCVDKAPNLAKILSVNFQPEVIKAKTSNRDLLVFLADKSESTKILEQLLNSVPSRNITKRAECVFLKIDTNTLPSLKVPSVSIISSQDMTLESSLGIEDNDKLTVGKFCQFLLNNLSVPLPKQQEEDLNTEPEQSLDQRMEAKLREENQNREPVGGSNLEKQKCLRDQQIEQFIRDQCVAKHGKFREKKGRENRKTDTEGASRARESKVDLLVETRKSQAKRVASPHHGDGFMCIIEKFC